MFPLHLHAVARFSELGDLFGNLLQTVFGEGVRLFHQRELLDLQLPEAAQDFIQLRGHGVYLQAQAGTGFVDEIDSLVRQKPIGDIALGECHGGNDGIVGDLNTVMHFIFILDAAQNGDAILQRRLLNQDGLKSALQSGVFLYILAVFVNGRGPDAVQSPPCQGGLEHIGSIHGSFCSPGSDHGVDLVDKEDDPPLGLLHLGQYCLEPLLKLPAEFRPRHQRCHIQFY